VAVAGRLRRRQVAAGGGGASNAALPLAGIGIKRQAVVPNNTSVAGVGHRDGNGQNVGDSGDNGGDHNSYHVGEVIHSDNDHR